MIAAKRTSDGGLERMIRRQDKRVVMMVDLRWLGKKLDKYLFKLRLPNMWRNQGVVRGRYGKGSRKWADNLLSTIRGKGFNKPLFSSRGRWGSSLIRHVFQAYRYTVRTARASRLARNATIRFRLWNTVRHSEYLEEGTPNIAARPHAGFIDGDGDWLRETAAKDILSAEPK